MGSHVEDGQSVVHCDLCEERASDNLPIRLVVLIHKGRSLAVVEACPDCCELYCGGEYDIVEIEQFPPYWRN